MGGPPSQATTDLEEVLAHLRSLRGVRGAFLLTEDDRAQCAELERQRHDFGPFLVENTGVAEVLTRPHVLCLIKDTTFREPPKPTVILVDADGHLVGREVLPSEDREALRGQRAIFLGRDFVIFAERGRGRDARLLLPPIEFPELDRHAGLRRAVSASPSAQTDVWLKTRGGFSDDRDLATVLVGFEMAGGSAGPMPS